jgi:hypothetical protein
MQASCGRMYTWEAWIQSGVQHYMGRVIRWAPLLRATASTYPAEWAEVKESGR